MYNLLHNMIAETASAYVVKWLLSQRYDAGSRMMAMKLKYVLRSLKKSKNLGEGLMVLLKKCDIARRIRSWPLRFFEILFFRLFVLLSIVILFCVFLAYSFTNQRWESKTNARWDTGVHEERLLSSGHLSFCLLCYQKTWLFIIFIFFRGLLMCVRWRKCSAVWTMIWVLNSNDRYSMN